MMVVPPMTAARRTALLALGGPCLAYLLGVSLLGGWVIDDAGISFAYARNLAHFDGFVSQPGRMPVEGFSNFLWVAVLVPTFWLHLFSAAITPKILGALAVFGAFGIVQHTLARRTGSVWPGIVVTSLLAVSPPIVIWSVSGLENGLFLLLWAAFYALMVERPARWQAASGVVAALLAMTRPDGLVFVAVGALVCLVDATTEADDWRGVGRSVWAYARSVLVLLGPLLALRLALFHLPWPHTYYAKRAYVGVGARLLYFVTHPGVFVHKVADFGHGLAGRLGIPILLATLVMLVWLGVKKRLHDYVWIAALVQLAALAAYLLLDDDWMGEYRFATAALAASLLTAVLASYAVLEARQRDVTRAWAAVAAFALLGFAPRLVAFAAKPQMPYADVERLTTRFNGYADALHLQHASILTPDVGAQLMESKLTVYDAAGTCEPDVIRTIKQNTPIWLYRHPQFYDWVFDTVKPTFVSSVGFWTNVMGLEFDPRFARDYVAIDAHVDEQVAAIDGRTVHSGDFVRRDALGDQEALARLRKLPRPPPRLDPLVVRLGERVGLTKPGPTATREALLAGADAAIAAHDPGRAITLLQRAIAAQGGDPATLDALARQLDGVGRVDEARTVWQEVLASATGASDTGLATRATERLGAMAELSPADRTMERGLTALYQAGKLDDAIAAFRSVLAATPNHYGANYQLAVALEKAGQRDAALKQWPRVLELAIQFNDAKSADVARSHLPAPPLVGVLPAGAKAALTNPAVATEKAPEVFKVKFDTTKGAFVVEVRRAWAPLGADRFFNLVKAGFYDDTAFFRDVPGFMVQFGISGIPVVSAAWGKATIADDPVRASNKRGFVTFANAGANTRSTQLFVTFRDNSFLDARGFSPFGKVIAGMEIVDALFNGYGEGPPSGKGPDQHRIETEGNAYLQAKFPKLDYTKTATIVP